jgi:hypothetical protein
MISADGRWWEQPHRSPPARPGRRRGHRPEDLALADNAVFDGIRLVASLLAEGLPAGMRSRLPRCCGARWYVAAQPYRLTASGGSALIRSGQSDAGGDLAR